MESESSPLEEEGSSHNKHAENASNGSNAAKSGLFHWLKKLMPRKNGDATLRDELEEIIQEHEESGEMQPEENEILRNVLKFNELRADDVMTPRPDIDAVEEGISYDELVKFVAEKEHTRIPVYRENMDDIIGFVHVKDLFRYITNGHFSSLKDVMREIIFVPPAMRITDLLEKMRAKRTHIAIVIDEYGGTDGLITIEDVMEEIVGDIEDEHDEHNENHDEMKKLANGVFEVSARMDIDDLEEALDTKIYSEEAPEDYDTVGGLIFTEMGKVPEVGESFVHDNSGINFKVVEADNRRIKRVQLSA